MCDLTVSKLINDYECIKSQNWMRDIECIKVGASVWNRLHSETRRYLNKCTESSIDVSRFMGLEVRIDNSLKPDQWKFEFSEKANV